MINTFQGRSVITPTCDTAIYATGELIGGKNTVSGLFMNGTVGCVIKTITVVDQANQKSALDLVFFRSDPTGTTFTDQAAFDPADADLLNAFVIHVLAADYVSFNDNAINTFNPDVAVAPANSGVLYMAVVSRGTPDYVVATDLQIAIESV